jgi:hypothetical protein
MSESGRARSGRRKHQTGNLPASTIIVSVDGDFGEMQLALYEWMKCITQLYCRLVSH